MRLPLSRAIHERGASAVTAVDVRGGRSSSPVRAQGRVAAGHSTGPRKRIELPISRWRGLKFKSLSLLHFLTRNGNTLSSIGYLEEHLGARMFHEHGSWLIS